MKITLDLPDPLVKQVKLRALRDGRKLKDTVADLLRKGLVATSATAKVPSPGVKTDPKTGLPFVPSAPKAPISKLSTKQIYALIHVTQEEEDLERAGLSIRR